MKRDLDLVRSILLAVEEAEPGFRVDGINGYDEAEYAYHVQIMLDAGMLEAQVAVSSQSGPVSAEVDRLTWSGHEFLDAIRNDTIWAKTKTQIATSLGSAPLDAIKAVAIALAVGVVTRHI